MEGGFQESGAYYTPPRLAELVVDIATQGWSSFLDKKCLDPACGSGVFLVILFQRMAEEWRRKNKRATNVHRALALPANTHPA
jgi:type I restriction-modification system DNA methylase subunit